MNFFGGIVVAETRTSRLSQRSFNGRIPERCLSAVGFTPTLGEGESAFPLAIWFPRNKGGGRHSMEKHVGFAVDYRGFVVSGMGEQVEYDDAGNITKRTLPNGLSANYSYDNKHRLLGFQIQTSYRTLSYDGDSLFPSSLNVQGQITSFTYYGAGALRSFTRGGVTYTFSYDEEGHCSQRTGTDGSVRLFHYEGGRLDFESVPGSWYAHYFYGEDGRPEFVDIFQNNIASRYFFLVDVYGTILKLLDFQGAEVANYQYGLYGDLTRTGTLPVPLSLAYKGYRYDTEAGLYILGCRAYDPCFGRFLSPDSPRYADFASPGGLNLYCYCRNNPVAYSDANGKFPIMAALIFAGAVIGAASYTTSEFMSYSLTGKWSWSWGQFAGSIIGGAIGGAFAGLGAGAFAVGFASGFTSTVIGMGLQNGFEGANYSSAEILLTSFSSGLSSGLFSAGMDFIRVPGLNSGRNSFAAITKSSITKSLNGTISSISAKTVMKALACNAFGSIGGTIWSGFADASDFYSRTQRWWLLTLEKGLV